MSDPSETMAPAAPRGRPGVSASAAASSEPSTINPKAPIKIRDACESDLPAIVRIYNEAVVHTTTTFDTVKTTVEQQRYWFTAHGGRYPLFVAESDGEVVGWVSLSRWSERPAYSETAEISLYVLAEFHGQGIGRRLMAWALDSGERAGLHTVIARVAEGNEASVRLHRTFGFQSIGVLKEVGFKFGRWLDVHLLQKVFSSNNVNHHSC